MVVDIKEIFTQLLKNKQYGLEIREEQIKLSEKIETAIEERNLLIAEAGTGIGKSYAYLIPALIHAIDGRQVVIVTATIALQHQLAEKDIPLLQKIYKTDIPVKILKGNSNYLCKSRFNDYIKSNTSMFNEDNPTSISEWANSTQTGDKEELMTHTPVSFKAWSEICTHEFSCGGARCKSMNYAGCFSSQARTQAKQAGIIITNYNLLIHYIINSLNQGIDLKDSSFLGDILPKDAIYILDEAHNFANITRQCLTIELNTSNLAQIIEIYFGKNSLLEQTLEHTSSNEKLKTLLAKIKNQLQELLEQLKIIDFRTKTAQNNCKDLSETTELSYVDIATADPTLPKKFEILHIAFQAVSDTLTQLLRQSQEETTLLDLLKRLKIWCDIACSNSKLFANGSFNENIIKWCRTTQDNYFYSSTLIFVNNFLKNNFFKHIKTVICLSATMTINNKFDYWINKVGAPKYSDTVNIPSPFPYKTNVLFAIPSDAPSPKTLHYLDYLLTTIPKCLEITEGRALILCTSYMMVNEIANNLIKIEKHNKWNLLIQDKTMGMGVLADKFRKDTHSVLIATNSYWEGFDAPGETLELLIITRLPFTSPNNLFFREEARYLQTQDIDPFYQLSIPEAELRLKQGFGRLMRSKTDRGIIFLTDNRIDATDYGPILVDSLPQCMKIIERTPRLLKEMKAFHSEIMR